MKTNQIKETQQHRDQKPAKSNSGAVKASDKNSNTSLKTDSSNKGKGPKGENL